MQCVALVDHTGMKDEEKDTGRIEAFSDGVYAIAIRPKTEDLGTRVVTVSG